MAPIAGKVRSQIVAPSSRVGGASRRRRWQAFLDAFPDLEGLRVVDLGGTAGFWAQVVPRPASVTVINVVSQPDPEASWIRVVTGDACRAADLVDPAAVDLVFSNSTIEHVGGIARREAFAAATQALAGRYWIQTPYRYFPLEPHVVFPGQQFLPLVGRAAVVRFWPLTDCESPSWHGALEHALWTELLSGTELRYLFPDAELYHERVAGLTKSLVAFRR